MQSSRGPSGRRGPGRTGSGGSRPGSRSTVRQRTGSPSNSTGSGRNGESTAGTRAAESAPAASEPGRPGRGSVGPGDRRRASLTTRAIALAVVLLVLTISYASSLRVYVNQRQDLAATRQQIIESRANIEQLSDEIARWNNPDYVRTQARSRLGWVMPGETGFRVIDADGKPVTGETEIAPATPESAPEPAWYQKLRDSIRTADKPAEARPQNQPPITENTPPR